MAQSTNVVPMHNVQHNEEGFDIRVKRALAERFDSLRDSIKAAAKKNPFDPNAIRALSILTASGPMLAGYIRGLSHKECEQIVNMAEAFVASVKAIEQ